MFGQIFNGNERFPRENGAVLRRHGNKRGVGESVGVFQLFERDDVRVVFAEMIPNVDIHYNYVPGTGGEDHHDKQGEKNRQPSATHNERYAGFQIHTNMPTRD